METVTIILAAIAAGALFIMGKMSSKIKGLKKSVEKQKKTSQVFKKAVDRSEKFNKLRGKINEETDLDSVFDELVRSSSNKDSAKKLGKPKVPRKKRTPTKRAVKRDRDDK